MSVLGLVACLNRELANKTKPAVGYLGDVKADQEIKTLDWLLSRHVSTVLKNITGVTYLNPRRVEI